ncbi:MAG: hypothetical protein RLZZ507_2983 [Cyanobacteriota bacterium]
MSLISQNFWYFSIKNVNVVRYDSPENKLLFLGLYLWNTGDVLKVLYETPKSSEPNVSKLLFYKERGFSVDFKTLQISSQELRSC